jgi:hypothetical protein
MRKHPPDPQGRGQPCHIVHMAHQHEKLGYGSIDEKAILCFDDAQCHHHHDHDHDHRRDNVLCLITSYYDRVTIVTKVVPHFNAMHHESACQKVALHNTSTPFTTVPKSSECRVAQRSCGSSCQRSTAGSSRDKCKPGRLRWR